MTATLVSIDLIQAAIVSLLKSDATLSAWLAARGAAGEIREIGWQGLDFVYPAVRVGMGTLSSTGERHCLGRIPFTVACYTEGDSSVSSNELAGVIAGVLTSRQVSGDGWHSGIIINDSITQATRTSARIWASTCTFRMLVYYD